MLENLAHQPVGHSMHPGMKRALRELRVYMWATSALVSLTVLSLAYLTFVHGA